MELSPDLHGGLEQLFKISGCARTWIGLVTNIGSGNVYQARHVFWFDAV
jgi:hypothetical protein